MKLIKTYNWVYLTGIVLAIFTFSCKENKPPILSTVEVTNITGSYARSGGNITDIGGAEVTERGIVWGTSHNPTVENNDGITIDGTGSEQSKFSSHLTGLSAGTTYYVRAYAKNSAGTSYGNQIKFTTFDLASVTTSEITNIASKSATSGGQISDDGGTDVTARGVVWDTYENPTVRYTGKTSDGIGTGEFVSNLTDLSLGTTYYVRAYATNSAGTAYGEQVSFSTPPTEVVDVFNPATGRTWMDRNLGASRAATSIRDAEAYGYLYQWGRATDAHQIRTSRTTSTLSNNDTPTHMNFITAVSSPYDWRILKNDNLWQGRSSTNNPCPDGYRLPTEYEFIAEYLSWSSRDAAGAFSSPLKLPMAGFRDDRNGSIANIGQGGYYWSSTVDHTDSEHHVGRTYSRYLLIFREIAYIDTSYRSYGHSVRCIKDN